MDTILPIKDQTIQTISLFFLINATFLASLIVLAIIWIFHKPHFITILAREYPVSFFVGLITNNLIFWYWACLIYFTGWLNYLGPNGLNELKKNGITDILEYIGFVSIALGTLGLWASPLIYCLFNFQRKVNDYYQFRLLKEVMGLKNHMVIFGFGDLGKGVCEEFSIRKFFETRELFQPILRKKETTWRNFPVPERRGPLNAKCISVRRDIIIIDRDASLFSWVRETPLGKIGLAKIPQRNKTDKQKRNEGEIYALAIVGDVKEETVWKNCKLDSAKLFISSIPGSRTIHHTYQTIRNSKQGKKQDSKEGLRGGIAVARTSIQKDLFSQIVCDAGIFMEFPVHQMGIDLAETVFAAHLRPKSKNETWNILISAHFWQILYLAEGLHMYRKNLKPSPEIEIYVLTDERTVLNRIENGKLIGKGLKIFDWKEIERQTIEPSSVCFKVIVDCVEKKAASGARLSTIEKILESLIKPDIVVLSHNDRGRLLNMLHEWIVAIETICKDDKNKYPTLIVGTKGEETGHVRDTLAYYEARKGKDNGFPLQSVDCRVNLYSDTKEEIGAIAEAIYRANSQKRYESATGIYLCSDGKIGGMGEVLSKLAKVKFLPPYEGCFPKYNDKKLAVSFYHCRFSTCPHGSEDNFSFSGVVALRPFSDNDKDRASTDIRQGLIVSAEETDAEETNIDKKTNTGKIWTSFFGDVTNLKCAIDARSWDDIEGCKCEYRTTCPIGAYRRRAENLVRNKKLYTALGKGKKVDFALQRYFYNTNKEEFSNEKEVLFFAKVDLCIRNGNIPGALATAVNTLLFRRLADGDFKLPGDDVFDITFLVNYITYQPGVIQKEIYGNMTTRFTQDKLKEGVIDAIQISPFAYHSNRPNLWKQYSDKLCKFLNENGAEPNFFCPQVTHKNFYTIFRNEACLEKCINEKKERCDLQRRCLYLNLDLQNVS